MKNKKGFVFVETIIVVAILITSLLYLYSTYISLTNNEKERLLYDDVSYLYRAYYVKKYFSSQRIDRVIGNLSNEDSFDNVNYVLSFGCGNSDLFDDVDKEGGFCELMSQELHISNLYVTYSDLSAIQTCTNDLGLCSVFSRVNPSFGTYLRTIGGKGESGYRIIVEFREDGKGNACSDDEHCKYYFSTLRLGDDL